MSAKIFVVVICVEAIIYFLLYNFFLRHHKKVWKSRFKLIFILMQPSETIGPRKVKVLLFFFNKKRKTEQYQYKIWVGMTPSYFHSTLLLKELETKKYFSEKNK